MQFRPKNFAKPQTVVVKKEEEESFAVGAKEEPKSRDSSKYSSQEQRSRPNQSVNRRKKPQKRDEVVFGGGVGGVCLSLCVETVAPSGFCFLYVFLSSYVSIYIVVGSERPGRQQQGVSTAAAVAPPSRGGNKIGASGQKHRNEHKKETKDEKQPLTAIVKDEMYVSSSDSEGEHHLNGEFEPTVLSLPTSMPRDVMDIDDDANQQRSEQIANIFTKDTGEDFMLFQIPDRLPFYTKAEEGRDDEDGAECGGLKDAPGRVIGKLLIMKSGKVKMKIGDVVMDVTRGVFCKEKQDIARIDEMSNSITLLGSVKDRLAVTPNTEVLLDSSHCDQWKQKHVDYVKKHS